MQAGKTVGRSKIAFATWRNGKAALYTINADGTGLRRMLSDPGSYLTGPGASWPALSPDGRKIAFQTSPTRDGRSTW